MKRGVKKGAKRQRARSGRERSGRKLMYPKEKEEKTLEWVLCTWERHLPVSIQMLRDKALAMTKSVPSKFPRNQRAGQGNSLTTTV